MTAVRETGPLSRTLWGQIRMRRGTHPSLYASHHRISLMTNASRPPAKHRATHGKSQKKRHRKVPLVNVFAAVNSARRSHQR